MKWKQGREGRADREREGEGRAQGVLGIKTGIKCCLWERALHAQAEGNKSSDRNWAVQAMGQLVDSVWVTDKEVRLRLSIATGNWQLAIAIVIAIVIASAIRQLLECELTTKTIMKDKFYVAEEVCVRVCVCLCVTIGHCSLPYVHIAYT